MGLIIAILLLILVFGVLGFTVVKFLLWIALILLIFVPLSIAKYRKAAAR